MQPGDRYAPIGVFDSGIGGLSVWRELVRQLPDEQTLYVADQGHVPYGPRSLEEIRSFSHAIARFLAGQGVKLVVVACNTASGAALHTLRTAFPDLPFVGMEPAVKPAVEHTQSGVVGVLATPTTFEGELFKRLIDRFGRSVDIRTQTCPGLVEAVESGVQGNEETHQLLCRCLAPLQTAGIDQLVLGCTHYPFAKPAIEAIVGPAVRVIDPSPAVARQVGRVLDERDLRAPRRTTPSHTFYTSGDTNALINAARALVGWDGAVRGLVWSGDELCLPADTLRGVPPCA